MCAATYAFNQRVSCCSLPVHTDAAYSPQFKGKLDPLIQFKKVFLRVEHPFSTRTYTTHTQVPHDKHYGSLFLFRRDEGFIFQ